MNDVDVDSITPVITPSTAKINHVDDLKKLYPSQFDTIGNFEGKDSHIANCDCVWHSKSYRTNESIYRKTLNVKILIKR